MKFYIVDCFAENKYQGNQLAVFIPDDNTTDYDRQRIASEIGFAETAFICSGKLPDGGYDVRIYTIDKEVPFAGHPTIGTSFIIHHILEKGDGDTVRLNLKVGQIPVTVNEHGYTMTQNQPEFGEILDKGGVARALSIDETDIRDDHPVQWVSTGLPSVIVPLKTVDAIERCRVNFEERQRFIDEHYDCNILFFAETDDGFKVRVFTEDTGFIEDAATGSANGNLAGYLLEHDYFGQNTISYKVSQGIEMGRPSTLYVDASVKEGVFDIKVGGNVYLIAEGEWE